MAMRLFNRVLDTLQQSAARECGDGELLAAFAERREEAAFTILVRRHGPMVLSVCRRVLGDAHLAEDAFQATFLVLARKAASLRQRDLVGNWLFGVAYRTALEARRRQARRGAHEKQVAAMPDASQEPKSDDELRCILDQELARLPDKYRAPLVLCDLEGRTRRDAAKHLRLPESTLSNRLTAARRLLARRLTRHGFALSGGALATLVAHQSAAAGVSGNLIAATTNAVFCPSAVPTSVTLLTEAVMKGLLLAQCKVGALVVAGLMTIGLVAVATMWPALVLNAAAAQEPVAAQARDEARAGATDRAGAADAPSVLKGHTHGVDALAFSPDGRYLASGSLEFIKIWHVATGKELRSFSATKQYVKALTFTRDGKFLIAGTWDNDVNNVKVWETQNWKEVRRISTGDALVHCVAVSPDGTLLATGGREKVLKVWDLRTGKLLYATNAHPRDIQGVAFISDGALIASCGYDSTVKFWDARSGKEVDHRNNDRDEFHWDAVAFGPKELRYLASAGNTLRLTDLSRGPDIWTKRTDEVMFHCVAFSPDEKLLVSGGSDKVVQLWDVETGDLVAKWEGHRDRVTAVAFSPDGALVASAGVNDGNIRLWTVPGAKAKNEAIDTSQGVVRQVKDDLIHVTLWENHGLKKGDTVEVFRLKPVPQYVGMLRLIEVQDRESVGRSTGVRSVPAQVNDCVVKSLLRGNDLGAKPAGKASAVDDPLRAQRDRLVVEEQSFIENVRELIRKSRRTYAKDSTAALKLLRDTVLQVWDHPEISERVREQLLNHLAAARHDLITEK